MKNKMYLLLFCISLSCSSPKILTHDVTYNTIKSIDYAQPVFIYKDSVFASTRSAIIYKTYKTEALDSVFKKDRNKYKIRDKISLKDNQDFKLDLFIDKLILIIEKNYKKKKDKTKTVSISNELLAIGKQIDSKYLLQLVIIPNLAPITHNLQKITLDKRTHFIDSENTYYFLFDLAQAKIVFSARTDRFMADDVPIDVMTKDLDNIYKQLKK